MQRIPKTITSLLAILITALPIPLFAGDPIDVRWEQICYKAINHEMVITTTTGEEVQGFCVSVDVNQVSVNAGGKAIRIARDSVARLFLYPPRHEVRSLGHNVRQGLKVAFHGLLTPAGPASLVGIPATLAWGAVSLPFCVLGDIVGRLQQGQEIRTK